MITIMKSMKIVFAAAILGVMAGCGSGGNGSSAPVVSPPATTKVAGTASKGILYPGSVSIYAVDASGVRATTPLATVLTDVNGQYDADIGEYSGAVVIEAVGTYTDEVTGAAVTIDGGRPMRAGIETVDAATTKRFAVTPLTDLAYTLAGTPTPAKIASANARVSALFRISDITAVEPVLASAAVLGNVTLEQQAYTLALVALSQMAKNNSAGTAAAFDQITTLLDSFAADLSRSPASGLGTGTITAFASALSTATSGSLSGFSSAIAALGGVGTTPLKLTLAVTAPPAGTTIGAIQGNITLPAGTSVRVIPGTNGEVPTGPLSAMGSAASSLVLASYVAQTFTFGVINANGIAAGDFAALTVDVASGSPLAASFKLGNLTIVDINGVPLTGLEVTVR